MSPEFLGKVGSHVGAWLGFLFCCSLLLCAQNTYGGTTEGLQKYHAVYSKLLSDKDYEMAELVLSRGLQEFPYEHSLYYARGVLRYDYLHKYREATEDYIHVVKLVKGSVAEHEVLYYRMCKSFFKLKEYDSAIAVCSRAIDIAEENKKFRYDKAFLLRAEIYNATGKYEEAQYDLMTVVSGNSVYSGKAKEFLESLGK
ncbi:MAG: hypothetical protein P1P84_03735 [Deferrisomatales bacterium]|nr:hypothetical protein [Deferrisomatales bacterium]